MLNKDTPPKQPRLQRRDRQVLEEIGYLAIHRTSKEIVIDQKKHLLNQLKKNGKGTPEN